MSIKSNTEVQKYFPALDCDELNPVAHWLINLIANYKQIGLDHPDKSFAEKSQTMIEGKVVHTNDVIQAMRDILGNDRPVYSPALAIALLHDTGRFPQALSGTFSDTWENDHSRMGVSAVLDALNSGELELPFDHDTVTELLVTINEHGKHTPLIKDSDILLLCRDADKLAISRYNSLWLSDTFSPGENVPLVSMPAVDMLLQGESIPHALRKTKPDYLISRLGFLFDINFQRTKELFISEGIVDDLLTRLKSAIEKTQPEVYRSVVSYIESWKKTKDLRDIPVFE